jgi:transposase
MIVRILKLKLNKTQETTLNQWLNNLTSVYNWGLKKIELNAKNKIYFSKYDFINLLADHGNKLDIPSHTIQGTLTQVHNSWNRCFKKISKKPKLKGQRNKLNSIPFPDPFKFPVENRIGIPGLGKIRFHKQDIPLAKIKNGRILKKTSGWYLCVCLDTNSKFPVKDTDKVVGIDPGFSTLLTLSDGTKIENPRELRKGAKRLAQAQRGKRKKLASRLSEKQSNQRSDRNHKISRKLVENYATICYSNDNFKGMTKKFGKSVLEAGLGQLIGMLTYKSRLGGRKLIPVNSVRTTMTCGNCWSLTGPTGFSGLKVRSWECSACGAVLDRDLNSAQVVLKIGLGTSLCTGIHKKSFKPIT